MTTSDVISPVSLKAGCLHVWYARLDEPDDRYLGWLSEGERASLQEFQGEEDRCRHVCAHAVVRGILARYTGGAPEGLIIEKDKWEKPRLVQTERDAHSALRFNPSRAGNLLAVAVCRGNHVGIDIEEISRFAEMDALAANCFTKNELSWLDASKSGHAQRFVRLWTCKEALFKACGFGAAVDLKTIDLASLDGFFSAQDSAPLRLPSPYGSFLLWPLQSWENHTGWVAVQAPHAGEFSLEYLEWPPLVPPDDIA